MPSASALPPRQPSGRYFRSGQVDIAFTRLAPSEADLEIETLAHEARVVVLPAAHKLATRASVVFADLRQEAFVTIPQSHNPSWRAKWLTEQAGHGLPGKIVAEVTRIEEILTHVAAQRGICIVPANTAELFPRKGVAYVTVADAEPAIVSLARSRGEPSPTLEAFIAVARAVAAESR